jgi:hypothetical protein
MHLVDPIVESCPVYTDGRSLRLSRFFSVDMYQHVGQERRSDCTQSLVSAISRKGRSETG